MKCIILGVILFGFLFSHPCFSQGIMFEQNITWGEIQDKAKQEQKYIFVDAFATWCGPCKAMDKNVYTNENVGRVLNDKFISVKVQMDSTDKDDEEARRWYADARTLTAEYKVGAFPTFLFFSPDGRLIHKSEGYRDTTAFIELAKFASDPERLKFYGDLDAYKTGKRDYSVMPGLVKTMTELLDDKNGAEAIAKDYKANYLDKLPDEKLLTRENIEFIFEHLNLISSTEDRFFKLFFNLPEIIDSLHNQKGAALYFVNYRIAKDEIWNKLFANDTTSTPLVRNPEWNKIYATISEKFGTSYAEKIVPENKIFFYRRIKDWHTWANLQDEKIKQNPPKPPKEGDYFLTSDTWNLNNIAWDAFLRCNDKIVLKKALQWSELSIKLEHPNPNIQYLDTKANLLYKLGRVKEAIAQEKKAIEIDKAEAKKAGQDKGGFTDEYSETVEKMKKGLPTWPQK